MLQKVAAPWILDVWWSLGWSLYDISKKARDLPCASATFSQSPANSVLAKVRLNERTQLGYAMGD
jgi:hypothetical protein